MCSAERVASGDLIEFGVAMGSRSCHMELPRFSNMRPRPRVRGGSLDLAMLVMDVFASGESRNMI